VYAGRIRGGFRGYGWTVSLAIRVARPDELGFILGLLAQMNPDDVRPSADAAATTWQRMREQPGRCVLVAVDGDRVVGSADCMIIENLTRGARPYMLIENVVVDASHRRRLVGTKLLDTAVERARQAGC
jgi:GNAT superfamily N-acetyltransferase